MDAIENLFITLKTKYKLEPHDVACLFLDLYELEDISWFIKHIDSKLCASELPRRKYKQLELLNIYLTKTLKKVEINPLLP